MKKKKLKPYMVPQCTIISMDDVPMLMSGSKSSVIPAGPESPAANMGIDKWGARNLCHTRFRDKH